MKKIGVVLAGCGHQDGAEIHEATLTLLFLDQAGVEWTAFAPNQNQHHVLNHGSGKEMAESRNVLVESARIARGKIQDLTEAKAEDLDAVIFPGGFGAAKNLIDWAFKGPESTVHPEVERLITQMHKAGKPQGFICIAPVIAARVMANLGVNAQLTIGTDQGTSEAIESLGHTAKACAVDEIWTDETNKLVSTAAYMLGPGIADIAKGIEKLVRQVVSLA